ncbi:MAG: ROK family protein [Candidatus Caldarchaeum sp.]|nr:ROK family protein [Candidatus Caldarchaeum sp.]
MEVIGIDFGASYTRFGIVRPNGMIRKKIVLVTPNKPKEIERIFEMGFRFLHRSGVSKNAPVGVATIGPLSLSEGIVVKTPNLGGIDVKLREMVEKIHRGPFVMMNDCTAAVWGEKIYGLGRRCRNIVYITLSTGIGGGAVVDNHLLVGKDGNAVEIGHIVVDTFSRVKCGCGGRGHWEALCSGTGLPKLAADIFDKKIWKTSREIFDAASAGNPQALEVVKRMAFFNAAGFASVINCYDPEMVVVGGGLALSHPKETVSKPAQMLRQYGTLKAKIKITQLGADAPLLGAAALTMHQPES